MIMIMTTMSTKVVVLLPVTVISHSTSIALTNVR